MATDWEDYALHILSVMSGEACFVNLAGTAAYAPRLCWCRLTRYEQRPPAEARRAGHGVRTGSPDFSKKSLLGLQRDAYHHPAHDIV